MTFKSSARMNFIHIRLSISKKGCLYKLKARLSWTPSLVTWSVQACLKDGYTSYVSWWPRANGRTHFIVAQRASAWIHSCRDFPRAFFPAPWFYNKAQKQAFSLVREFNFSLSCSLLWDLNQTSTKLLHCAAYLSYLSTRSPTPPDASNPPWLRYRARQVLRAAAKRAKLMRLTKKQRATFDQVLLPPLFPQPRFIYDVWLHDYDASETMVFSPRSLLFRLFSQRSV